MSKNVSLEKQKAQTDPGLNYPHFLGTPRVEKLAKFDPIPVINLRVLEKNKTSNGTRHSGKKNRLTN